MDKPVWRTNRGQPDKVVQLGHIIHCRFEPSCKQTTALHRCRCMKKCNNKEGNMIAARPWHAVGLGLPFLLWCFGFVSCEVRFKFGSGKKRPVSQRSATNTAFQSRWSRQRVPTQAAQFHRYANRAVHGAGDVIITREDRKSIRTAEAACF